MRMWMFVPGLIALCGTTLTGGIVFQNDFSDPSALAGWNDPDGNGKIVRQPDGKNALEVTASPEDSAKGRILSFELNPGKFAGKRVRLSAEIAYETGKPLAPWQGAKLMLAGSLVFGAIDTVLIPVPYLAAWLILEHLAGNTIWPMDQIFFWVFAAIGARWLASLLSTTLSHLSAMQVTTDLRTRLLEHLGRLPMHWHAGQTRGGLKKVFTSDIGQVESFLAHHIPDTVSALLLPILSLICLLWVNWILGLLLVLLFVTCIVVQTTSLAKMSKGSILGRYNRALEGLNSAVVEFVHGMPVIKLFNRELSSFSKMRSCVDEFRDIQTQGYVTFAPRWALFSTLTVMPFTLAAVAGAPLYLAGLATLSEVTLFLMLGCVCLSPLTKLVRLAAIVSEMTQSLARLSDILSSPPSSCCLL